MALTPASILADYSSGIGTQGATLQIKTEDQRVGIGTTNPQGTLQVGTAITMGSGIVTATAADLSGSVTASTASFSGNVSVGGVLTYEDVTSVDSVGIITARSNVIVGGGLSVTGISTFNGITTSTTTIFSKDFSVSGVSTLGGNVVVGGATTELVVRGDARVTGILTVGTASLTLDGTTGKITGGSLTDAQVAGISTSIDDAAVDVFVYDTSKDSDGGAWRKRTQHTSWYNETLNTSTRGSRREFPSVAVIVVQDDPAYQVAIYDGDDPDLPMWMIFERGGSNDPFLDGSTPGASFLGNYAPTSVSAFNGIICVGCWRPSGALTNLNAGLRRFSFIEDNCVAFNDTNTYKIGDVIANRNVVTMSQVALGGAIVNVNVRDVAMTVLPNAPIDDSTGLSVPTIAVATDGGISVIKDDGNVVDIINSNSGYRKTLQVKFTTDNKVVYTETSSGSEYGWMYIHEIPSLDEEIAINTKDTALGWYDTRTQPYMQDVLSVTIDASINVDPDASLSVGVGTIIQSIATGNNHIFVAPAENSGITIIEENRSSTNSGLVAYATTSYNTGYQVGDIKGAFLSGISTVNVTGSDFITNGNFDDTDISYWNAANGATLTHQTNGNPGGNINVASGPSSNGYASRSHTVVVGKYYTLSFDHYHVDGSEGYVNIGTSTGSGDYVYHQLGTSSSWTTYSFTIKATSTNLFTGFYSRPNGNVRYDNIVLRVAEEDRSVNNNGLQVFGTITKSPVAGSGATAADLVAYSGFSNDNMLLNRASHDFGTTDSLSLCIIGWFKLTDLTGYNYVGSVADYDSTPLAGLAINSSGDANAGKLYLYDNVTGQTSASGASIVSDGNWHHAVGVFDGNIRKIYQDGKLVHTSSYTSYALNLTAVDYLAVGHAWISGQTQHHHSGSLSLVRFSKSIPSSEQVKKMYNDEKHLFEENAKCTLYGSSDAVTALGYDDDEGTLYVGTSSGRSDFRGLRRINNTTTAVTTAISASNGLVAEE